MTFKVDALGGATFTLGFDYKTDNYTLSVDEIAFDDLPEIKEEIDAPEVGHSIDERFMGPSIHRVDFLVFLKGYRTPISIEHDLRSGLVSLDVDGKPWKSWHAKTFTEAFSVPYNFTHDGHKFTVRINDDKEGDEVYKIELEIDGILFENHPYVDKDFGKTCSFFNFFLYVILFELQLTVDVL